jgi:uncharacterized protein DUF929
MVDWDRVQELRDKGWDWDRIAEDSKVGYQAPRGITDKGRALRTLYAKRARTASREPKFDEPKTSQRDQKPKWTIARVGMLLTPLLGIWFLIAYFIPSPVGIFVSAIPTLGIALAAAAFLLAFGLLRSEKKWTNAFRGAVAAGVILGLLLPTVLGIAGILSGAPTLTSITSPEPDKFSHVANTPWTSGGKSVFFFFGSAACPYCSASSWAMEVALERFGTPPGPGSLTGYSYSYSSSTDVYPNTPEVVLAGASLSSNYIALQVAETTSNGSITLPAFQNEFQRAYFVAYDSAGSIPFVVIGGLYFTVGSLVNPVALTGLDYTQVQQQIDSQTGTAWDAIAVAADWLTAFMLKADGGQPAGLLTGNVLSDYNQIS